MPAHVAAAEEVGTQIGPYKLIEQIGEGGFGVVYIAEQQQPIRRKVAVKILKPGMDTRQVIARFDAERQALALMEHANIAHVLDAGETASGRPYFVMELVKGTPITQYCDQRQLTPKERLSLFLAVCQAVQHAHQKGIIHRDLKPSNVLVATHDGKGVPKVIDFGVAKALGQPLTDRTLVTGLGNIVGTFEYMSPEQAEFNSLDIDTRADIYSMGVMLYELLTGTTPLTRERVKTAAITEVLRLIREEDPPRPSTRLGDSKDSLPSVSAHRKLEPDRLTKELRGEVDWIVMKCLEKDRARRYETASDVGRDIERYLSGDPVEACPPSASYRLRKFVVRHKRPMMAAALVLIALVAGIIGTTSGLLRAEAARRDAIKAQLAEAARAEGERQAKITAENRLTQIEKGIDILGSIFTDLNPDVEEASGKPLRALLGQRLDVAVNELEGDAVGDPLAVARLQRTLGQSLLGLGHADQAIPVFIKARDTFLDQSGSEPINALRTMAHLANAYRAAGKFDEALPLFERTVHAMTLQLGQDDADTLDCMGNLALAYKDAGKLDQALPLYEKTLELAKRKYGPDHSVTLTSTNNLAVAYQAVDKLDQAIALFEYALATRQDMLGPDHADTLISRHSLANAYLAAGKPDQALPLFQQTLDNWMLTLGNDHPYTLACTHNLAMTYSALRDFERAVPLFNVTLEKREKRLGPSHPLTLITINQLATAYRGASNFEQALPLLREAVEKSREGLGLDHPDTLIAMNNLAGLLREMGQLSEANELFRETVTAASAKLGFAHSNTQIYVRNLADSYARLSQPEKAEPLWRQLAEFWKEKAGAESPQYARELNWLGLSLIEQDKAAEAEPTLREALRLREKTEAELWTTFSTQSVLGAALMRQNKYAEAEALLLTGYEGMKQRELKIPAAGKPRLTEALQRLVQLYESWDKPDQAAAWRSKLEAERG
jgi:serine/threonine protein kinase/tetratricopeptide (TPR) repeat protein